jgi:hypothetical protein
MSYKMVNPNTGIWWVPLAGLSAPSAPSAAQITAGTRISGAVTTGYTLKFNDSDVDPSKTVEDEGNVETPTLKNYEGKISLFKDELGTGTQDVPVPLTVFTTAVNLFKTPYVDGWIVTRYGRKASVAVAAGHIVSVFKFKNDYPRTVEGDAGNPIMVEVDFLPQGEAYANVVCAA